MPSRFLAGALHAGQRVLDLAYPPLCLHCGERLEAPGPAAPHPLCRPCREDCVPVRQTGCDRCGLPVLSGRDAGPGPCADCRASAPPFVVARSAFLYRESGPLRSVLLRLKHAADASVAAELAAELVEPVRTAAARLESPRLCPVPLHWLRRLRRGYNQAELLARHVALQTGLPVEPVLWRRQATRPQKGDRAARLSAMAGVFGVRDPPRVRAADFLLVDDVLTTGATASECARALLAAGARAVGVVTLARVYVAPRR